MSTALVITGPTGPTGDAGPSYPGASIASTLLAGLIAEAAPAAYAHPINRSALDLNYITINAFTAITADATNLAYATLTIRFYGPLGGAATDTVNIDFTTTQVSAGRYFTGSIGAHQSIDIAFDATITLAAGGSFTYQISKVGVGLATPAMRITVYH